MNRERQFRAWSRRPKLAEYLAIKYPYTLNEIEDIIDVIESITGRCEIEDMERVIIYAMKNAISLKDSAKSLYAY